MSPRADRKGGSRLAAVMADGSEPLTHDELERQSIRLGRRLRAAGLRDGDRVAILMENRPAWLMAVWAVRRATLLFVPINWHLRPDEVRFVIEDSDARAVITSEALLDLATQATAGLDAITLRLTVGPSAKGFVAIDDAAGSVSDERPQGERDGGGMLYSSGTSGRPKGVLRAPEGSPFGTPNGLETMLTSVYGIDADKKIQAWGDIQRATTTLRTSALALARASTFSKTSATSSSTDLAMT